MPNADPFIGTTVLGYFVQGRLGEGGMGIVYEGVQPEIGKKVAIKVLRPEIAQNVDIMARLVSEARAVNAIKHRGIIDIFGYAKLPDGRQAIVMEYLEGESLEQALSRAGAANTLLPQADVVRIIDEVLQALGAAHQAQVVHRDMKPSNIYLCKERTGGQHVKVLDFGVAKMGAGGDARASGVLGTPLYMAPEQAQGDVVSPAIDLYAVGVILFEMLTGRLPFGGDSPVRVMYHHLETPPPVPSSLVPAIPGALDAVVLKLLAKKPQDRPPTAEAVRQELHRIRISMADPSALKTVDDFKSPLAGAAETGKTFVRQTDPGPQPAPGYAPTRPAWVPDAQPPQPAIDTGLAAVRRSKAPLLALAAVGSLALGGAALWAAQPPALPKSLPPERSPSPLTPLPPVEAFTPDAGASAQVVQAPTPPEPATEALKEKHPERLLARIRALERRLTKARRAGEDVELVDRQLARLRERLADRPVSPSTREQIDLALTRLEADVREGGQE